MKFKIEISKKEVIALLSEKMNMNFDDVDLVIFDEVEERNEEPSEPIKDEPLGSKKVVVKKFKRVEVQPYVRDGKYVCSHDRRSKTELDFVRSKGKYPLYRIIKEKGFDFVEVGQLCGVSKTTIARMCEGYICTFQTFQKVVRGLELTEDEANEVRTSLTKHQSPTFVGK